VVRWARLLGKVARLMGRVGVCAVGLNRALGGPGCCVRNHGGSCEQKVGRGLENTLSNPSPVQPDPTAPHTSEGGQPVARTNPEWQGVVARVE
jgi:hypothetical protein